MPAASPRIVSLQKIWDRAEYNSFTDLTRFRDRWYCTLRESDSHIYGEDGKVRVIVSDDGLDWRSAGLFAVEGRDLRDPKLAVTADGRLMVLMGAMHYVNREEKTRDSRAAFSDDGNEWTPLETMRFEAPGEHPTDGHWMWRVTWHEGASLRCLQAGESVPGDPIHEHGWTRLANRYAV